MIDNKMVLILSSRSMWKPILTTYQLDNVVKTLWLVSTVALLDSKNTQHLHSPSSHKKSAQFGVLQLALLKSSAYYLLQISPLVKFIWSSYTAYWICHNLKTFKHLCEKKRRGAQDGNYFSNQISSLKRIPHDNHVVWRQACMDVHWFNREHKTWIFFIMSSKV